MLVAELEEEKPPAAIVVAIGQRAGRESGCHQPKYTNDGVGALATVEMVK